MKMGKLDVERGDPPKESAFMPVGACIKDTLACVKKFLTNSSYLEIVGNGGRRYKMLALSKKRLRDSTMPKARIVERAWLHTRTGEFLSDSRLISGPGFSLRRARTNEEGISILEMLLVMTILLATVAVAIPSIDSTVKSNRSDTAMENVKMELRRARQLAIDQRHRHTIAFTSPRTITITRLEPGTSVQVSQTLLPSDIQFSRNGIATEPDNFSTSGAINFSGATSVSFNPDGSAVDGSTQICNGVVYLAIPGEIKSTRAVTVFGTTGRVRGYTYKQAGGSYSWQ